MEGLRKDDLGVYQLALPLQDSPQGKHATHFSHQPRHKRWHVVGPWAVIYGVLQARILEWVAISFSNA